MHKIIISVAPVAHTGKALPADARNPVLPHDIAEEVIRCSDEGAAIAHLHVRNTSGDIVGDTSVFSETISMIRAKSDIIIQGSTGGVSDLSLDERSVAIEEPRVQMASLNMGSTNFGDGVYINKVSDIIFWAEKMKRYGVVPELQIFDLSMLYTVGRLRDSGVLSAPLHYNFSLGFEGALPAEADVLCLLRSQLPSGSHWGILHEGISDFSLLIAAMSLGAQCIRVGYEDGCCMDNGRAMKNWEMVRKIRRIAEDMGFSIASAEEAAEMLNVKYMK